MEWCSNEFQKRDRVIVKSEIEDLFGGEPRLAPDIGELGEICSVIKIMGSDVPAIRVKFVDAFEWWVHPKHLELVKQNAQQGH